MEAGTLPKNGRNGENIIDFTTLSTHKIKYCPSLNTAALMRSYSGITIAFRLDNFEIFQYHNLSFHFGRLLRLI